MSFFLFRLEILAVSRWWRNDCCRQLSEPGNTQPSAAKCKGNTKQTVVRFTETFNNMQPWELFLKTQTWNNL